MMAPVSVFNKLMKKVMRQDNAYQMVTMCLSDIQQDFNMGQELVSTDIPSTSNTKFEAI